MSGMSVTKFRLSALLKLGATSGWLPSMPVSMMPTRTPSPWLTAYEPAGVAPIIRISHCRLANGSGAIAAAVDALPAGASASPLPFRPLASLVSRSISLDAGRRSCGARPTTRSAAAPATTPVAATSVRNLLFRLVA